MTNEGILVLDRLRRGEPSNGEYNADCRPGDTITARIATEEAVVTVKGRVISCVDRGWYRDCAVLADGLITWLRLYRDGPLSPVGVVACKVLARRNRRAYATFGGA